MLILLHWPRQLEPKWLRMVMVMVMIMVLIMIMIVIMMMIMPRQLLHDFVLDDQEYVDGLGH